MEKTAEFVSPKHPDKLCDYIADCLLDAYLQKDKQSRCAIEVMGGHNLVAINGEVTSLTNVDVKKVVQKIVGRQFKIVINLVKQSPEISRGVDNGGAGDQGIMRGYATSETKTLMPLEYELARSLCQWLYKKYPYDGKTQITINDKRISKIVASFQKAPGEKLKTEVLNWLENNHCQTAKNLEVYTNPAGDWDLGSFDADTGLSGRKLVVDNYGPEISIGGGSFSGKDCSKVDRSATYMARRIAVDLLKRNKATQVYVKLAYAIGKAEPVMATASIDGKEMTIQGYDLTPKGIYRFLKLDSIKFSDTSNWGAFGRKFSWH